MLPLCELKYKPSLNEAGESARRLSDCDCEVCSEYELMISFSARKIFQILLQFYNDGFKIMVKDKYRHLFYWRACFMIPLILAK